MTTKSYFTPSAERAMTDVHQKYCRCVAHVAAKQSDECLKRLHSGERPARGDKCYPPYPLCTRSTRRKGPGSNECLQHYALRHIPADEQRALALLKTGKKSIAALREAQIDARKKIAATSRAKTVTIPKGTRITTKAQMAAQSDGGRNLDDLTVKELRDVAKRQGVSARTDLSPKRYKRRDELLRDLRKVRKPSASSASRAVGSSGQGGAKAHGKADAKTQSRAEYVRHWGKAYTREELARFARAKRIPLSEGGKRLTKAQLRLRLARVAADRVGL